MRSETVRSGAACTLVSAAVGASVSIAAWYLLPYELLELATEAERFLLWESIMWMLGLALTFFGIAAFFGATDMYGRTGDPYVERTMQHNARRIQEGMAGRYLFTDLPAVPWLMVGIGAALLAGAVLARTILFGGSA